MLLEAAANFLGELVQNHLTNIVAGFSRTPGPGSPDQQ